MPVLLMQPLLSKSKRCPLFSDMNVYKLLNSFEKSKSISSLLRLQYNLLKKRKEKKRKINFKQYIQS